MAHKLTYEELRLRVEELEKTVIEYKEKLKSIQNHPTNFISPMDETGKLNFTDLFDMDEIQKIQDAFAKATGVASIITTIKGYPLTKPSNFCRLCKDIIRKTKKGLANCISSDAVIGRCNPEGPIIQPCLSGGLWDAGASISVGNKHIANWLIGQVRNDTQREEEMMNYAGEIGADEKEFRAALAEVTIMPIEQFEQISNALFLIANQMSKIAFQNVQQAKSIIERKHAEEAFRKSETKYRELVQNANSIILRMDTRGNVTFFNEFAQKFFGYTDDEILNQNVVGTIVPETETTGRNLAEMIKDIGTHPERYISNENENIKRNSERVWIAWTNKAIRNKEGEIIEILCIGNDITERKQAEEALRKSEEKFRILVEESPFGISIIAKDGQYKYLNPKFVELFGYTIDDIPTGRKWFEKAYPDQEYKYQAIASWINYIKVIKVGETKSITFKVKCKDSSEKVIRFSGSLMGTGDQIVIYEDVTNTKKLESQLQQAQKMESLGTLAGGVAHDFNNILGAIIGYTELAQDSIPEDPSGQQYLNQVLNASSRAKELVGQILAFSRQGETKFKPVKISTIVKEALKLLKASLPATVDIRQHIEADTDLAVADSTQIHQVLMNLCTNAAHAMHEEGGVLEVILTKIKVDATTVFFHTALDPGSYLRLTVRDTGYGLDSEILERIFDPYFTTKAKGEGTGLGLAVVHGIVKSHGGGITVESNPGKGTAFHVLLPCIEEEIKTVDKETIEILPTGQEHILFIDDEPDLVTVGEKMLEKLGYKVVTRTSSIEALELFRTMPDRFDLVITDQTMPKMAGATLAVELMQIRSDIPIILCTGFSEIITAETAKAKGIRGFIKKPILKKEIARTVRKVLDQTIRD